MGTPVIAKDEWVAQALDRYERPLLSYAARIVGDIERARDVVQETFLRLCEADPERVNDHLAAWLYTVCRNSAFKSRHKEARMSTLDEETTPVAPQCDARESLERADTHRRVLALLESLPQEQQEAFHLKFSECLTFREISSVMGVSLGTVSNLIAAALNAIRREFRAEMGEIQEVES